MLSEISKYLDKLHATHDEDSVDRINYLYTNVLLLGFSLLLSAKQYVGEPLQCWVPAQFKGGWETYVERHCFIENTYFTRMNEALPESTEEKRSRELAYYQWLPIILALQAALCYAPRMLWKLTNKHSGINLSNFIPMSMLTKKEGDQKELKGGDLYDPLVGVLQNHANLARRHNRLRFGRYVTWLYLSIKGLWLLNVLLQFFVLDRFLGPEYVFWGIGIVSDLIHGRHWRDSGHFPRVTMCDVTVREMGNLHNWTVQCVLMVNMFAEKIFLFLWFWFCFVAIVTAINLGYWLFVTLVAGQRREFIRKYLEFKDVSSVSDHQIDEFNDNMLRADGLTILRLIADNSGDLAVAEIVHKLWENSMSRSTGSTYLATSESDNGYVEEDMKHGAMML